VALTSANLARPDAPLQRLADEAALASVASLASSLGQPDHTRIEASITAARAAVSGSEVELRSVSASPERMTSAVVVMAGQRAVTATARYIAPFGGSAPQASADLLQSMFRTPL
jgi:hypothetical protein